jgi:16S rRNA (uracil1498-N3)-methyltransferase
MHIFYAQEISSNQCTLSLEESRHCIKVLRLKINDQVCLINGKGNFYIAKIIEDDPKNCLLEIIETKNSYKKREFYLHIAICPTKNSERFEWFVEKATEIGIDEITPLITEHSERKNINIERLNKIVIAASKQSVNPYFPVINEITKIDKIINESSREFKYIASYSETNLKDIYSPKSNVLILIGPEGDFSENEIKKAESNKFTRVNLGNNRLRTETAGIVACHTINLLNL